MDEFLKTFLDAVMPVLIQVVIIALPIIATALTGLLVQWIRLIQAKIQSENPTSYEKIVGWAKDAVLISEQLGISGLLDISGKKRYAVDYVQKLCDASKIKIDIATLEDLVEKAVYTELTQNKLDWGIPVETKPTTPDTKEVG